MVKVSNFKVMLHTFIDTVANVPRGSHCVTRPVQSPSSTQSSECHTTALNGTPSASTCSLSLRPPPTLKHLAVPSREAATMRVPLGLTAIALTRRSNVFGLVRHRSARLERSHATTTQSHPAVHNTDPPQKQSAEMAPACPLSDASCCPVARSYTRTDPSLSPTAIERPSGWYLFDDIDSALTQTQRNYQSK